MIPKYGFSLIGKTLVSKTKVRSSILLAHAKKLKRCVKMSPFDVYAFQCANYVRKSKKELKKEERKTRKICMKSFKEKGDHSSPLENH